MSHPADPDELLEVLGDELRAIVRDDPGLGVWVAFTCPLDDRLDIRLGHAIADFPVNDKPTTAIEQAAKVEERTCHVDVRDVDVPVFVRSNWLLKAFSFQ